jgi:hypothetical protein
MFSCYRHEMVYDVTIDAVPCLVTALYTIQWHVAFRRECFQTHVGEELM